MLNFSAVFLDLMFLEMQRLRNKSFSLQQFFRKIFRFKELVLKKFKVLDLLK